VLMSGDRGGGTLTPDETRKKYQLVGHFNLPSQILGNLIGSLWVICRAKKVHNIGPVASISLSSQQGSLQDALYSRPDS
jgi:hypothetical protein